MKRGTNDMWDYRCAPDYDYVKELILKGYELVPEAYRQRFRNCQKESNQTYVEFARKKEQLFDRWCNSKKVNQIMKICAS